MKRVLSIRHTTSLGLVQGSIALTYPTAWEGGDPFGKGDLLFVSHAKS